MEKMNHEIFQMIDDLHTMHRRQRSIKIDENAKDRCDFPFEAGDSFDTDPLGFLETTMKQYAQARETFRLLRVLNRHSPVFYQMAAELEKTLSQLGSACITKAVLEQQGETFPFLDDLTITRLREKTAFLFRKSYAAFMESMSSLFFNEEALKLSNRFAALDRRLNATDEKISLIRAGKLKITAEKPDTAGDAADLTKTLQKTDGEETIPSAPFSPKSRALPIDRSRLKKEDPQTIPAGTEPDAGPACLTEDEAEAGTEVDCETDKAFSGQEELFGIMDETAFGIPLPTRMLRAEELPFQPYEYEAVPP